MTRRDCTCPRARHEHGTRLAYIADRCHCDDCRAANARYCREWRAGYGRWVPRIGMVRRLQALAADGWPLTLIAEHTNLHYAAVGMLRSRQTRDGRVARPVAAHIAKVYDDLWWRTPPASKGSAYARNQAERNGWAASWRWEALDIDDPNTQPWPLPDVKVDEAKVYRAMAGERMALNNRERRLAVLTLAGRGLSDGQIAGLLHSTPAAVGMIRRRNRKDTAA